jgi:hypothetical protein
LHRLTENEEVSVYCDANVDISHVAPRGTESELSHVVSARVGSPQQARPYQRRGVVAGRTQKNPYPAFNEGEEMKGENKSAALMLAHHISMAHEMVC